jgi:hypothetical protein
MKSTAMEFKGEGETNDAGSGDADVGTRGRGVLHGISLVGGGEVIVWRYWFAG